MIVAPSNYENCANQIKHWDTSDSEQNYQCNLTSAKTRATLEKFNYIDYDIEYRFNSHGFRAPEFDQEFDIVCFGCSFTMGTGVREEHTWPFVLSKLTGLTVANLGHAGSSNDTAYRMARHYLPYLKPKYAIWLQTDKHRIEIIDQDLKNPMNILATSGDNIYTSSEFVKLWMSSSVNQCLNLAKNTDAFKYLCHQASIKDIVIPRNQVTFEDLGRDLIHPGPKTYQKLAEYIKSLLGIQAQH